MRQLVRYEQARSVRLLMSQPNVIAEGERMGVERCHHGRGHWTFV
jgi:hypothetical protein